MGDRAPRRAAALAGGRRRQDYWKQVAWDNKHDKAQARKTAHALRANKPKSAYRQERDDRRADARLLRVEQEALEGLLKQDLAQELSATRKKRAWRYNTSTKKLEWFTPPQAITRLHYYVQPGLGLSINRKAQRITKFCAWDGNHLTTEALNCTWCDLACWLVAATYRYDSIFVPLLRHLIITGRLWPNGFHLKD